MPAMGDAYDRLLLLIINTLVCILQAAEAAQTLGSANQEHHLTPQRVHRTCRPFCSAAASTCCCCGTRQRRPTCRTASLYWCRELPRQAACTPAANVVHPLPPASPTTTEVEPARTTRGMRAAEDDTHPPMSPRSASRAVSAPCRTRAPARLSPGSGRDGTRKAPRSASAAPPPSAGPAAAPDPAQLSEHFAVQPARGRCTLATPDDFIK